MGARFSGARVEVVLGGALSGGLHGVEDQIYGEDRENNQLQTVSNIPVMP